MYAVDSNQTAGTPHKYNLRKRMKKEEIGESSDVCIIKYAVDSNQTAGTPHKYNLRKRMKKEEIGESSDNRPPVQIEENKGKKRKRSQLHPENKDEISSVSDNNERDLRDAVDSNQTVCTPRRYKSKRMRKEIIGESSDICSNSSTLSVEKNDESKETCGSNAGCPVVSKKSGDHVINNVVKVYGAIVKSFIEEVLGGNFQVMIKHLDSSVVNQINQPFPDITVPDLIYEMSVELNRPPGEADKNAIRYGNRIGELRDVILAYMKYLYQRQPCTDDPRPSKERTDVDENVDEFIRGNYVVDQEALDKWLEPGSGNTRESYNAVRSEVDDMFRKLKYADQNGQKNGMVDSWVKELSEAFQRFCSETVKNQKKT